MNISSSSVGVEYFGAGWHCSICSQEIANSFLPSKRKPTLLE